MIKLEKELEVLMESPEFVERIMQMESKEEVKKAFESEGVKITDEQLNSLGKMFNEVIEKLSTLSEKELQSVTGGLEILSANVREFLGMRLTPQQQFTKAVNEGKLRLLESAIQAGVDLIRLAPDAVRVVYGWCRNGNQGYDPRMAPPTYAQQFAARRLGPSNETYCAIGAVVLAVSACVGLHAIRRNIRRWFLD